MEKKTITLMDGWHSEPCIPTEMSKQPIAYHFIFLKIMLAVLSMCSPGCWVLIVKNSTAFVFLLQKNNNLYDEGILTRFLPCGF